MGFTCTFKVIAAIALWTSQLLTFSNGQLFDGPHVFLTLNAKGGGLGGKLKNRMVEINWNNVETVGNHFIELFNQNPAGGSNPQPLQRFSPTSRDGSTKTNIRFPNINFRQHGGQEECVGFWITYSTPTQKITNCLRLNPNWMNTLRKEIGDSRLSRIMIPGTHNSGAWRVYKGTIDDLNPAINYGPNQEDDIYTQLMHGIRYFDIRIGHYPLSNPNYWLNHGVVRLNHFKPLLDDVKAFVEKTKEIVILDIHGLPFGFDKAEDASHTNLIALIESTLGPHLYRKSSGNDPTLNQIWNNGKTIILTYPESSHTNKHDFLWPAAKHLWANKNNVNDLKNWLAETIPSQGCGFGQFHAAMAELTPSVSDIILKPRLGLRGMAQQVNIPLTQWYRSPSWYSKANIVATDYYLGNNIIEMAITVNRNRASCQ